jgi:hypothetical protein
MMNRKSSDRKGLGPQVQVLFKTARTN